MFQSPDQETSSYEGEQRSFTVDSDRFQKFKELSTQKEVDAQQVLLLIKTYNPELWAKLTDPDQQVVITSLGAGDGEMEFKLLRKVRDQRGSLLNLTIHCVDPSPEMKEAFKSNATAHGMGEVIGEYITSKVEDPQQEL